jgi:glycosyltransferase involved in cell wall biosynthesis
MSGIGLIKVVPTLLCGGTENQFMTLARSLDSSRFTLHCACLRRWGPFAKELDDLQIPLVEYRTSSFRSVTALVQQWRFARYVRKNNIQIVHAYNFYGNVFAIPPGRLAASVVIASIRDRGPYLTSMQRRVQRYVCRLADCVLVNAEAVKTWLVGDGYDPRNIVVIPNGVDLSRFSEPGDPVALRRSLGIAPEAPLVAVVSRLSRLKGIEHFLEAAALVAPSHPDARFLVVGEPSPINDRTILNELSGLAERLGIADRVIFTGLRADVPALLGAVNVAVMPSLNEALSNVLLESMAAGAAVVATDVGGTAEALADGDNGLLVPPADPAAMAAAIGRLLSDAPLARELGARARQTIADRFSLERMVAATDALYAELLARKQRKPVWPHSTAPVTNHPRGTV